MPIVGPGDGPQRRVLRGGSWNNNARNCRAANRNNNAPDDRNNNIGFRVCLPLHFPRPDRRAARVPDGSRTGRPRVVKSWAVTSVAGRTGGRTPAPAGRGW
ncbi:MAG: SUMF1/EgtB/PvdO family nonheme iron enzyme [Gemmataceae bacterium]|nr:SUMF1/EgtB/PvdO family nonheme iron enzyme [Gemmataceae bacterium]